MKNRIKAKRHGRLALFGSALLAMALVFTFALVSCDNGSGGSKRETPPPQRGLYVSSDEDSGDSVFLDIQENPAARSALVIGDSYELTIRDKNGEITVISSGTVMSSDTTTAYEHTNGGYITTTHLILKSDEGELIWVTFTNGYITAITGDITYEGNTRKLELETLIPEDPGSGYTGLCKVIYDLNGGTGVTPTDPNSYPYGSRVLVLPGNKDDIKGPDGLKFSGWNSGPYGMFGKNSKGEGKGLPRPAGTYFTITQDDYTLYAQWADPKPKKYKKGDKGPSGGVIVYVTGEDNDDGFEEESGGTCEYLEAAPDILGPFAWSSLFALPTPIGGIYYNGVDDWAYLAIPGTGTAIGSGKYNTDLILALDPGAPAAKACRDYRGGGYSDWFLPSLDECMEVKIYPFYPVNDYYFWVSSANYLDPLEIPNSDAWAVHCSVYTAETFVMFYPRQVHVNVIPMRSFRED